MMTFSNVYPSFNTSVHNAYLSYVAFLQVQAQLYARGLKEAIPDKENQHTEFISFNQQLWDLSFKKYEKFYYEWVLPEIVDSRKRYLIIQILGNK